MSICGQWNAAPPIWRSSGCYNHKLKDTHDCTSYLLSHLGLLQEQYWKIRQIKTYAYKGQNATIFDPRNNMTYHVP